MLCRPKEPSWQRPLSIACCRLGDGKGGVERRMDVLEVCID